MDRQDRRARRRAAAAAAPVTDIRVTSLTIVKPVARTRLTFGAVVWAHIPFDDVDAEKTRPAVVLHTEGWSVAVLPGTSAVSRLRFRDRHVEIDDLGSAGLRRPTGIRLRTVRIEPVEIIEIVGVLGEGDAARLAERLEVASAA